VLEAGEPFGRRVGRGQRLGEVDDAAVDEVAVPFHARLLGGHDRRGVTAEHLEVDAQHGDLRVSSSIP
jgi:hypothetical protein